MLAADPTYHVPRPAASAALMPGTAHFRGALAVPAGFDELERVGGMRAIAAHSGVIAPNKCSGAGKVRANIHHAVLTQRAKTAVHFGA